MSPSFRIFSYLIPEPFPFLFCDGSMDSQLFFSFFLLLVLFPVHVDTGFPLCSGLLLLVRIATLKNTWLLSAGP